MGIEPGLRVKNVGRLGIKDALNYHLVFFGDERSSTL